ncbi:hypothetical protein ACFL5A_01430 [Gemmatimonadota bacterium]
MLGQGRWTAYAAAEVWSWIQFMEHRREGGALQKQYRDLAWFVARRVSSGPRRDGDWEYYEALTHFQASGAYDGDPTRPGVQPEDNPETFNGTIWELAQELFYPEDPEVPVDENSPQYRKAFNYYLSRAYAPELTWNWGTNTLHRSEYAELIRASDENLRKSTNMIGVILANHLLSAVDALVSGRLGLAREAEPRMEIALLPGPFYHPRVSLQARLPAFWDP